MKLFFRGLFHFLLSICMKIPCHLFRRILCKLLFKSFSMSCNICRNIDFRNPYNISIGEYTTINKDCVIDGRGFCVIGNNVDIAQDVNIWTEQHDYNSHNYEAVAKKVIIEDYAWIASRATILPGVRIGRGAVVASGAVVTKDVPPMAVVGGVPAKIISHRDPEALNYMLTYRTWFS